jgi:hypothetical protein
MSSHNRFLMVTADPYLNSGSKGQAHELVRRRLAEKYWPLYANTRNRKTISVNDELAFYVGGVGKYKGCIIARATVDSIKTSNSGHTIEHDDYLSEPADKLILLTDVREIEPIDFRSIVRTLSLAPKSNVKKWGVILMGGSRKVNEKDWKKIFGS